jgi:hypothetical protein
VTVAVEKPRAKTAIPKTTLQTLLPEKIQWRSDI